jgi:hypothetical protein
VAISGGVYGSAAKVVERTATDAAFKLATSGRDLVFNGRRDAVWRARSDGVVEVARAEWGRVELYEVHDDGTSRLVAASSRSASKVAASICAYGAGGFLVVGVLGAMVVSEGFAALTALTFVLFPLTFVLRGRSNVRPWIRVRFGSDDDWANLPWEIEGTTTTGNQAVALAALANRGTVRYRVLDDGALEVVVRGAKQVEVLTVDCFGAVTVGEALPSKRFELNRLRGADVTWHAVIRTDPTD